MPHHVTQRGNPRQETFSGEEDYQHYLELMAQILPRRAGRDLSILLDAQSYSPDHCPAVRASLCRRRFHGGLHAYLLWLIGGDHSPIAQAQQNR